VGDGWPVAFGDDAHLYGRFIKIWRACYEKSCAAGGGVPWPQGSEVYESGTITAIDADGTVLTDSAKTWLTTPPPGCTGGSQFFNVDCDQAPWIARFYDVIIDSNPATGTGSGASSNLMLIVRAAIVGNGTDTLQLAPGLKDYVAAGFIPSIASLAGKRYFIIKRSGLWWSDRWPAFPNDNEKFKGVVGSGTATTLTDPKAYDDWSLDQFAGDDLLVWGTDSRLHRVSITANVNTVATFAGVTGWTPKPGEPYGIVAAGKKCWPGRDAGAPFWWHGGAVNHFYSHYPDDAGPTPTNQPANVVTWSEGCIIRCPLEPVPCEDTDHHDALFTIDNDFWSSITEECSEANKPYSPNLFKSLRQIQAFIEGICIHFVNAAELAPGVGAIPTFVPATLFKAAGMTWYSTTASAHTGSTLAISNPSALYYPMAVYYAVKNTNGTVYRDGTATLLDSTHLRIESAASAVDDDWHGKTIILAPGWDRNFPREFRSPKPKTIFIPDTQTSDAGVETAIDAARIVDFDESGCLGAGQYIKRDAATTYADHDGFGQRIDGDVAFVNGELARLVGDNWNDPTVVPQTTVGGPMPADTPYWDRFYRGGLNKHNQAFADDQRVGITTGALNISPTLKMFADDRKHWFKTWHTSDAMRVEGGVATGGTATTLTDSAIAANGGVNERACFWAAERFADLPGAYAKFVIEVDKQLLDANGDPFAYTYRTPITSADKLTGKVTFAAVPSHDILDPSGAVVTAPALDVSSGNAYRIFEPYEPNRFESRRIKLSSPAGATYFATAFTNDDQHIWITPDAGDTYTLDAGWSYQVVELKYGGVYKWDSSNGGRWVEPVGTDPRGPAFRPCVFDNLPTRVRRFGRLMKGDYVTFSLVDQIYDTLNLLWITRKDIVWSNRLDPLVCENTVKSVDAVDAGGCLSLPGHRYSDRVAELQCGWGHDCNVYGNEDDPCEATDVNPPSGCARDSCAQLSEGSGLPSATSAGVQQGTGCGVSANREMSYAQVAGLPTCLVSTVEIWVFADFTDTSDFPTCGGGCAACQAAQNCCGVPGCESCCNGCDYAFSNNGDGDFIKRGWGKMVSSVAVDSGATKKFRVGRLDPAPVLPPEPPFQIQCQINSSGRGYVVEEGTAIVKWTMLYLD
jgi:hypothetical protein